MMAVEISDQIGGGELKTFLALHHLVARYCLVGSDMLCRIDYCLQIIQAARAGDFPPRRPLPETNHIAFFQSFGSELFSVF